MMDPGDFAFGHLLWWLYPLSLALLTGLRWARYGGPLPHLLVWAGAITLGLGLPAVTTLLMAAAGLVRATELTPGHLTSLVVGAAIGGTYQLGAVGTLPLWAPPLVAVTLTALDDHHLTRRRRSATPTPEPPP